VASTAAVAADIRRTLEPIPRPLAPPLGQSDVARRAGSGSGAVCVLAHRVVLAVVLAVAVAVAVVLAVAVAVAVVLVLLTDEAAVGCVDVHLEQRRGGGRADL